MSSARTVVGRHPRPEVIPFLDLPAMQAEVGPELDAAYRRVVTSGAFVGGEEVRAFESEWAAVCGTDHAVGVANGTDALELALQALGIGPGDEVIVPCNTFVATAEAVVRVGAVPRFVDVDPGTLLVTPAIVEGAITSRTTALIIVHLYGQMPDMTGLMSVAEGADLTVLEDAAQAHGATWKGRPAGSYGDASCFSFYPGKNLGALGDGGAVVTSRADVAARVRSIANHGRDLDSHHVHHTVGRNSRLDGLQAAFLRAKLPRLAGWNAGRRRAVARYRERLADSPARLVAVADGADSVHHLNVVQVASRDRITRELASQGIRSGVHYPVPCHRQPSYIRFASEPLPVAEAAAERIVSLPLSPHLTMEAVDRTCDVLLRALEELR